MARNRVVIRAQPADVFAVLGDGETYAEWVVGARRIRGVDEDWPQPGSTLHHAVGVAGAEIKDDTTVLNTEPERRLRLLARVRPFGRATIDFELRPHPHGTELVMHEVAVDGPFGGPLRRAVDPLIYLRNLVTLGRLRNLVERSSPSRD